MKQKGPASQSDAVIKGSPGYAFQATALRRGGLAPLGAPWELPPETPRRIPSRPAAAASTPPFFVSLPPASASSLLTVGVLVGVHGKLRPNACNVCQRLVNFQLLRSHSLGGHLAIVYPRVTGIRSSLTRSVPNVALRSPLSSDYRIFHGLIGLSISSTRGPAAAWRRGGGGGGAATNGLCRLIRLDVVRGRVGGVAALGVSGCARGLTGEANGVGLIEGVAVGVFVGVAVGVIAGGLRGGGRGGFRLGCGRGKGRWGSGLQRMCLDVPVSVRVSGVAGGPSGGWCRRRCWRRAQLPVVEHTELVHPQRRGGPFSKMERVLRMSRRGRSVRILDTQPTFGGPAGGGWCRGAGGAPGG